MQSQRLAALTAVMLLAIGIASYITYNSYITKETNTALAQVPQMNAIFSSEALKPHDERSKAAAELQAFLQGARLSQFNLDALNEKIVEVGLEVDRVGNVHVLNKESWRAALESFENRKEERLFKKMFLLQKDFKNLTMTSSI